MTASSNRTAENSVFENYGARAVAEGLSYTSISGRYKIQEEGVKRAVIDIVKKLELTPTDDLLDIGCGAGNITIPLSFLVRSTTCIDHEKVLELLQKRLPKDGLTLMAGSFFDVAVSRTFSKVLSYGVVLCLPSQKEVIAFVDKAASLVAPGGRLLIGDLPNADKKNRFSKSQAGKDFSAQWEKLMENPDNQRELSWTKENLKAGGETAFFDDNFVCELMLRYRQQGFESYILSQPSNLAFGNTREDLLLVRPA